MIAAVVLAAGESRRMKVPKALLTLGEGTFVSHLIDELQTAGIDTIVVVVGADAEQVRKELQGRGVLIVENPAYAQGQLSSVVKGIEATERFRPDGVLICPVDHPGIDAGVITRLHSAFYSKNALIVLPTFNGKRGHPALFSARLTEELKAAPPNIGARSVLWAHEADVVHVETGSKGVIQNIDTPADYEDFRRDLPRTS